MAEGIIGIVGALVGFVVTRWIQVSETRARIAASLHSLRAEVAEIQRRAEGLRQHKHRSTLGFWLPAGIGQETIGKLAAEGLLDEVGARDLVTFYAFVADVNRNLDLAGDGTFPQRVVYAAQKADHLFDQVEGVELATRVEKVITGAMDQAQRRRWWKVG